MIEFLKSTPLFQDIGDRELESLLPLLKIRAYEKGATILQEGENGNTFYLIKTGSVEVLKKDPSGASHPLTHLKPHDWFGEMAFLGEGKRQSSIRALENTETVAIPTSALFKQAETNPIFSKIAINFARKISRHLHQSNEAAVRLAEKQVELIKSHDHMGRFLVYLFILLTLFFDAVKLTAKLHPVSFLAHFMASLLIVGVGLFGFIIVKQSHYSLEFYGITLKNGWKYAKEAFIWTLPFLAVMWAIKWALVAFVPRFKHLNVIGITQQEGFMFSVFDASKVKQDTEHFWIALAVYIALVPIQEFIARGCLQGCLYNFFTSSNRALLSIVTSNLLFGLFHGFKTLSFSLAACLIGLFWGWIYYKQKTLVGPIVSHALVGIWAFGFLNYGSILIF